MPQTRAELSALLDRLEIAHRTLDHEPVFQVEDGAQIKTALPGGHTKNRFLKDAKAQLWLISALGETRIDLKAPPARIGVEPMVVDFAKARLRDPVGATILAARELDEPRRSTTCCWAKDRSPTARPSSRTARMPTSWLT